MEPGPYIQTVSGHRFNPFEPDSGQIDIVDIATALANQCRFGGHTRTFYSVAQHSCLVSDLVRQHGAGPADALWALLHDASEAYLVDLPHPIKHRSEQGKLYAAAESGIQAAICDRFGLPAEPPESLKAIDRSLLATERAALSEVTWHWPELEGVDALDLRIEGWPPDHARAEFLNRYELLTDARQPLA